MTLIVDQVIAEHGSYTNGRYPDDTDTYYCTCGLELGGEHEWEASQLAHLADATERETRRRIARQLAAQANEAAAAASAFGGGFGRSAETARAYLHAVRIAKGEA